MDIKIKSTLIILVTFIIGMIAGGMITQAFFKYQLEKALSMRLPKGFAAHFERIIEPTDVQRNALREILHKYGEKYSEIGQRIRKDFLPIQEAMRKELNSILTPEQRKRLDMRFFEHRPKRFFQRFPRKFPPPFPGEHKDRDGHLPGPPWREKRKDKEEKPKDSKQ